MHFICFSYALHPIGSARRKKNPAVERGRTAETFDRREPPCGCDKWGSLKTDLYEAGRTRGYSPTAAGIALPAEVDDAYETLSGPATRTTLQRAYYEIADARYQRLADLRAAHL
jgi:hypothetical protein